MIIGKKEIWLVYGYLPLYDYTIRDNDRVGGVSDFRCPVNWQTIMTDNVGGISDALKASDQ